MTEQIKKTDNLEELYDLINHDLSQPLHSLETLLSILEGNHGHELNDEVKQYLEFIKLSSNKIRRATNSSLIFIKILIDDNFELVDLNSVLDDIGNNHKNKWTVNKAEIRYNELPSIVCQKSSVSILLNNLVSNALKFSRKDISPKIDISCIEDKNKWTFIISDNGIGIHQNDFERIFQPFTRLQCNEEYVGSGFGLNFCKKIIEKHKGEIWVESKLNVGTSFYFTIKKGLIN